MLTRAKLDEMRCAGEHPLGDPCAHGPLYIHSRCHPASPTWVIYAEGVLRIECAECKSTVAEVAVA